VRSEPERARAVQAAMAGAACALAIVAVILPPEIEPWSRAACQVIGAAAALAALSLPGGASLVPAWSLSFLPFAAASVLSAACRQMALDEAADAALLVAAGLLGRRVGGDERGRGSVATVFVALGAAAAVQAALQHHVLYPARAAELAAQGPAAPAAILGVLRAGRPSGPFILPAALGGFLALVIPLSLSSALRAPSGLARAAALAAAFLEIYALALTRSFGAVLSLAAGLLLALPNFARRRRRRVAVLVVIGALLASGYFLRARRLDAAAAEGVDPLTLRLGNWSAAARMTRDHPFFGTGPGSFGTFYPRYMRQGMNETKYAHNSYLQASAGWGVWILWPVGALAVALLRAARRARSARDPVAIASLAGASSFLVHNLGDFTAYLPGVAVPAALLLGMALGREHASGAEARGSLVGGSFGGPRLAPRGPVAMLLLLLPCGVLYARHAIVLARSISCRDAALAAADRGDLGRALQLAREAADLRRADPEPQAFLAQMILDRLRADPDRIREGERAAARAAALNRESAILHYTLALCHQASGETTAAFREIDKAHQLYPLKPLYALESAGAAGNSR